MSALCGLLAACAPLCADVPNTPGVHACRLEGWPDREVIVHVPDRLPPSGAPLLLSLHGGGGSARVGLRASCPDGEESSPGCLSSVANRAGILLASPDGTATRLGLFRSWNAGGGEGPWRCVGGRACREGVDDVAFLDALQAALRRRFAVSSVHAAGMSNGGAMAHRLACEGRVDGIVAVGGANQALGAPGCAAPRPVAVLQIHGDADPCWGWDGTVGPCLERTPRPGFVSVGATMEGWSERLHCSGGAVTATLPVRDAHDPTRVTRASWQGCDAPLSLVRIQGGGHAWPDGHAYFREARIGLLSRQVSGAELVGAWVVDTDARLRAGRQVPDAP